MKTVFQANGLTKKFDSVVALDHVDIQVRGQFIIGLLGRNGSGKTTLFNHLMGLQLPTAGNVLTLGTPAAQLDHRELIQIGFVPQEIRLLDWMTVEQHLGYVATFYPRWDRDRQSRLLAALELDATAITGALSTGNLQKLAIILSPPASAGAG
jgi:ABC-2 type transport system ATP-binding protein